MDTTNPINAINPTNPKCSGAIYRTLISLCPLFKSPELGTLSEREFYFVVLKTTLTENIM